MCEEILLWLNMRSMSFRKIIPTHYKRSANNYIGARNVLLGIAGVAIAQFFIAMAFLMFQSNVVELVLNLSTSIYALSSLYFFRFFRSIKNFINMVLSGFYLYLFGLVLINGGILSDAIFVLPVLLMISIFYTGRKHTYFWGAVVLIFIALIYSASLLGYNFNPPHYSETYRLLNLITFLSPLLISSFVFSTICRKKSTYQNRQLDKLERLKEDQNEYMYEITHDLKSPTNTILGLLHLLEKSNLKQKQLKLIELIKKANDSSNQIINSLPC